VVSGEWPDAQIDIEAPPAVALAQAISARLAAHLEEGLPGQPGPLSAHVAADETGLSQTAISRVLKGTTWPDIETIAILEYQLYVDLWGNEHFEHFIKKYE